MLQHLCKVFCVRRSNGLKTVYIYNGTVDESIVTNNDHEKNNYRQTPQLFLLIVGAKKLTDKINF